MKIKKLDAASAPKPITREEIEALKHLRQRWEEAAEAFRRQPNGRTLSEKHDLWEIYLTALLSGFPSLLAAAEEAERLRQERDDARDLLDSNVKSLGKQLADMGRENDALRASNARLREAAKNILPYLRWTIGPESPGHHPTLPSAIAAIDAALSADPAPVAEGSDAAIDVDFARLRFFRDLTEEQRHAVLVAVEPAYGDVMDEVTSSHTEGRLFDLIVRNGKIADLVAALPAAPKPEGE